MEMAAENVFRYGTFTVDFWQRLAMVRNQYFRVVQMTANYHQVK